MGGFVLYSVFENAHTHVITRNVKCSQTSFFIFFLATPALVLHTVHCLLLILKPFSNKTN